MKVIHLISGPINSGASKGAINLHSMLLKKGINSSVLTDDNFISESKKIFPANLSYFDKLNKFFRIFFDKFTKILYLGRKSTTFSPALFGKNLVNFKKIVNSDIIHLHWVNNSFLKISNIKKFNKPIVWTMRDMWPFTGGCHYTLGCEKYSKNCGCCPQLGSNSEFDLSKIVHQRKKKYFDSKNLYFVAVSKWLQKKAKKSSIIKKNKVFQINNIINKDEFYFEKKNKKNHKITLTFGCQNVEAEYKGFKYFLGSLKYINKFDLEILIFGNLWNFKELDRSKMQYKYLGFIKNQKQLREIYSKTDIFITPSIEDAFPKGFAEAMLCKSAILCFEKTTISDFITHKKTGYISKHKSSKDIAHGIKWLIKSKKRLEKIKFNSRQSALKVFDQKKIINEYIDLYKKITN